MASGAPGAAGTPVTGAVPGRNGTNARWPVVGSGAQHHTRQDLSASAAWADSVTKENAGFVAVPGDTLGKRQPNVARWRATALASYRWNAAWSTSAGARHSGPQFRTLDNSDVNGLTCMGVSQFFTVDLRARYQINQGVSAAWGIDNANNCRFWNFLPCPQRSPVAELKIDL